MSLGSSMPGTGGINNLVNALQAITINLGLIAQNLGTANTAMVATNSSLASLYSVMVSINSTMGLVWPQATGTASTAIGGTISLPGSAVGFLQEFSPSLNATVLVPYYNP